LKKGDEGLQENFKMRMKTITRKENETNLMGEGRGTKEGRRRGFKSETPPSTEETPGAGLKPFGKARVGKKELEKKTKKRNWRRKGQLTLTLQEKLQKKNPLPKRCNRKKKKGYRAWSASAGGGRKSAGKRRGTKIILEQTP